MRPLLVTGFEPFGNLDLNPTALVLERLAGDERVKTALLPVEYAGATTAFSAALEEHKPAAVLALGLAFTADGFRVERIAWNRDESDKPDNTGAIRNDHPIVEEGPTALGSSLPARTLMEALGAAGFQAVLSDHAGGYVCNHLFYRGLYMIERRGLNVAMGFVHVPPLPEQVAGIPDRSGLPLDEQERAVRVLVNTAIGVLGL